MQTPPEPGQAVLELDLPQASPADDVLAELVAEAQAQLDARRAVGKVLGPGPVYQGVSKTIRVLTATGKYRDRPRKLDPELHAGLIAQARQLARAVDKLSGHNPSGWVANGRDLSPVSERLETVLQKIRELAGSEQTTLQQWLLDEDAPREQVQP